MKRKNKILASSLNDARLQNAALCQRLNQFNAQMLELREEITELKREKQIIKSTARTTETEIQRKLDVSVKLTCSRGREKILYKLIHF